jgi:hypothetical protein
MAGVLPGCNVDNQTRGPNSKLFPFNIQPDMSLGILVGADGIGPSAVPQN